MASKWIAEKMGDMVEDAVKKALGHEDKDKDEKEGGFFSKIFDQDDDKKKHTSEKDRDDKKESFFSKIFDRDDDDDKKKESKSGFSGLFSELEGVGSAGGHEEDNHGGGDDGGAMRGRTVELNDGDLFNDLMDVAEETAGGKEMTS